MLKRQKFFTGLVAVFMAAGWMHDAAEAGFAPDSLVRADVVNGKFELSGALVASNNFSDDFFWEYSNRDLARSGFDDGDLHPFVQWPAEWILRDGEEVYAYADAGYHKGRDCVELYWSRESYDYWTDPNRGPGTNARLGQGVEVESPWKDGGFISHKEIWYSFDLFVPAPDNPEGGFPDDKTGGIAQIFQITDGSGGSWAGMLVIRNNELVLRHRNPRIDTVVVDDIPRDEWNQVVINTVASNRQNGKVEMWYGGENVYSATGINFGWGAKFTADDKLVEDDYQFVKLGHYAFQPSNYDEDDERILYYDNITNFSGDDTNLTLRVEAENFREGGEGVAYHDTTDENQGGKYRINENVDIKVADDNNEGAYAVGWTEDGEWLEYDVEIPATATYNLELRVASASDGGTVRFLVDGEDRTGEIDFEPTGSWDSWTTIEKSDIDLESGQRTVRLEIVSGGFNLNWFELNRWPTYQLDYSAGEGGIIEGPNQQEVEAHSDGEAITAVPAEKFRFVRWSDGSTENPRRDMEVTESISVKAEFALALPYEQDFEHFELGKPGSEIPGWIADRKVYSSKVIGRIDPYIHEVGYPLPGSSHEQVLDLNKTSIHAKFAVEGREYPRIYLDKMIRIQTKTEGDRFKHMFDDETKLALHLNEDEKLELFHGGDDGDTDSFTAFDSDYEVDTWARLTVAMNLEGADNNQIPLFRVFLNGHELSSETEGFASPSSDSGDYTGGSWFRSANYSGQQDAGGHRSMGWLRYVGRILVDDFVLTDAVPATIIPSYRVRTTLTPEHKGSMSPVGERVNDSTYEVKIEENAPAAITYTAEEFYKIETLISDDEEVETAAGEESYQWRIDAVTEDVSNHVTFAAMIWDSEAGGDGRSPLWWADQVGYEAGEALSVYEGFLINQEDLDEPFRIVEFGLNETNRPFVKWHSTGPAHGQVTVKSSTDLTIDRDDWPTVSGGTGRDEERNLNTWTAEQEADPRAFYHVLIKE